VVPLLFITICANNFFEHLLPIFTENIAGWSNVDYSQIYAAADIIGGIGGILAGGWLIETFGKKLMVNVFLSLWGWRYSWRFQNPFGNKPFLWMVLLLCIVSSIPLQKSGCSPL